MQSKAHLKILRTSPRKTRLVADTVRGLAVSKALSKLEYDLRSSAPVIAKLVKSAVANAAHNDNHTKDNLYIVDIQVGEGPTLKRFRPRAYGRAFKIMKRTSRITIILSDEQPGKKATKKVTAKTEKSQKEEKPKKVATKKATTKKATTKKVATKKVATKKDDLTKIEGIGPKIAEVLTKNKVTSFASLATQKPAEIEKMIADVKGNHDPSTWPKQADLAAKGEWDKLEKWQEELDGGKE